MDMALQPGPTLSESSADGDRHGVVAAPPVAQRPALPRQLTKHSARSNKNRSAGLLAPPHFASRRGSQNGGSSRSSGGTRARMMDVGSTTMGAEGGPSLDATPTVTDGLSSDIASSLASAGAPATEASIDSPIPDWLDRVREYSRDFGPILGVSLVQGLVKAAASFVHTGWGRPLGIEAAGLLADAIQLQKWPAALIPKLLGGTNPDALAVYEVLFQSAIEATVAAPIVAALHWPLEVGARDGLNQFLGGVVGTVLRSDDVPIPDNVWNRMQQQRAGISAPSHLIPAATLVSSFSVGAAVRAAFVDSRFWNPTSSAYGGFWTAFIPALIGLLVSVRDWHGGRVPSYVVPAQEKRFKPVLAFNTAASSMRKSIAAIKSKDDPDGSMSWDETPTSTLVTKGGRLYGNRVAAMWSAIFLAQVAIHMPFRKTPYDPRKISHRERQGPVTSAVYLGLMFMTASVMEAMKSGEYYRVGSSVRRLHPSNWKPQAEAMQAAVGYNQRAGAWPKTWNGVLYGLAVFGLFVRELSALPTHVFLDASSLARWLVGEAGLAVGRGGKAVGSAGIDLALRLLEKPAPEAPKAPKIAFAAPEVELKGDFKFVIVPPYEAVVPDRWQLGSLRFQQQPRAPDLEMGRVTDLPPFPAPLFLPSIPSAVVLRNGSRPSNVASDGVVDRLGVEFPRFPPLETPVWPLAASAAGPAGIRQLPASSSHPSNGEVDQVVNRLGVEFPDFPPLEAPVWPLSDSGASSTEVRDFGLSDSSGQGPTSTGARTGSSQRS